MGECTFIGSTFCRIDADIGCGRTVYDCYLIPAAPKDVIHRSVLAEGCLCGCGCFGRRSKDDASIFDRLRWSYFRNHYFILACYNSKEDEGRDGRFYNVSFHTSVLLLIEISVIVCSAIDTVLFC